VRNVLLAALAVFVIVQGDGAAQPRIGEVLGANTGGSSLTVMLLVLVALSGASALFMTYVLLRQNGRLALRIEALEARLDGRPGPEEARPQGLPLDTEAPAFVLPSLDGGRVSFEELRRSYPEILLFFSEPGCGACDAMLADVGRWQRDHADRLRIVPISRGSVEANRDKMAAAGLTGVLLQEDREVGQAYLVTASPSALLIAGGRIASPIAAGADAIRSLVADATRPKPYAKGEQVMPLSLPDLDGMPVELSQLGPRKTVILFWSPNCGFCTDALDDVKWWEQHRDPALADLLVITTGDAASNRAQGFLSRVVLDPDFEAGNRFGSAGTPSAVIVDERGRVVSDVAVGAPEVLALAGSASPARRVLVT
jgi:peroxiredoxin